MLALVLRKHIPVRLILVASGPYGTRCHTATVKSIDPDEDMDQLPSVSFSIVGTLCWFNQYDRCCRSVDLTRYGGFFLFPAFDEKVGHAGR